MPTKNIFAGFGVRSEFVNLIYTELMKREFVSYADVLALYCGRPKGYYDKMACNSEPGYGELKKAFPEVLKAEVGRGLCGFLQSFCWYITSKLVFFIF